MKKLILAVCWLLMSWNLPALTIVRYVSPDGSGDGMTEQTPTSDLGAVLEIGSKVEQLNVKVAPGVYSLNLLDTGEGVTFSNIELDGTWNNHGSSEKVRIDYPGIEFKNSRIKNVSFTGGVSVNGGRLEDCDAGEYMYLDLNGGDGWLYNCTAKGFQVTNWSKRANSYAQLFNCSSTGGGGYGLSGENIGTLYVTRCKFNNNEEGGAKIQSCKEAHFIDSEFCYNSGDGALRFVEYDNSGRVYFNKCRFLFNKVTYNHSYNIYIYSDATFEDCLFVGNTEKDYDRKGFVHLVRPDFEMVNCTFMDNRGALELESFYPSKNQIVNCVFWNNGSTNIYTGASEEVPLLACAMDHGTGVPELDAEKGIITLTQQNKGFDFTGTDITIQPYSILVNKGINRAKYETDIYYHPRNAFGGVDIGCVEFVSSSGMWRPDSIALTTFRGTYGLAKAEVNSETYYCLFPEYRCKDDDYKIQSDFRDIIYLDKMPIKPKLHDNDQLVERHTCDNDVYTLDVLFYDSDFGTWCPLEIYGYRSAKERPKVKVVNGRIDYIKPQKPAAPKTNKKGAKKRTKNPWLGSKKL